LGRICREQNETNKIIKQVVRLRTAMFPASHLPSFGLFLEIKILGRFEMKSDSIQNRMDAVYFIDWSLKQKTAMVLLSTTLSLDGTKKHSFRGEERKDQIKRKPSPKDDLVSGLQNADIRYSCLFSKTR